MAALLRVPQPTEFYLAPLVPPMEHRYGKHVPGYARSKGGRQPGSSEDMQDRSGPTTAHRRHRK